MSAAAASRLNVLRAARLHLSAQVEQGTDTQHATCAEAEEALAGVERELTEVEAQLRDVPEAAHLFRKGRRKGAGRTRVLSPQSSASPTSTKSTNTKEATVARKSKAAQLEEVKVALRKAEKSAGSTKWALEGAGAKRNPPSKERKAHLTEKLAKEQALIADLRAQRDELAA